MSKRIPFDTKPEESSIVNRIISMQKAGYKAAVFCSKDTCSDNPPAAGWYNILYWGMASEQIILASCTWQPKTTYYGVFNLDETAPTITWREVITKSDLFAYNWISNPNTCTTPFSVVNGWSPDLANVPDDAKNTWNSLQTIWVYPAEIGDLTKQRLQILITGNNTLHTRMYANGNFSNWS